MRPLFEMSLWAALGALAAVGCHQPGFTDGGLCAPMTLPAIPTGTFPTTGLPPVLEGGTIVITDTEVRLSIDHEEWGHVEAVYARIGEAECHRCD